MNENQLLKLVKKHDAPLYVYDGDAIIKKYKAFEKAFKVKNIKIHFAAKALTNLAILRLFKELGAGLDCVSIQEIKMGIKAGFKADDIIYTPNGVSMEEYQQAVKLKTKITVDNISILEKMGRQFPKKPIFIRINPHLNAGGNSKISVGKIDSKFGISIHQIPLVLRIIKKFNIEVEGLHIHTGSDVIEPEIFERVAKLIFNLADEFDSLQSIDFGSGFKVKYKKDDLFTDVKKVGAKFSKAFNNYCKKRKKQLTLRFEPGKYLVSEAGVFLTKVNVIKQTTACTFVAVDSGFNHLIRPMFYDAHHEIENISNPKGEHKLYSVVGYICESDTFAVDRSIREVKEGDILLFKNAGAYCFSMASNYNSRFKPAEVLILNGKSYLIRKRETLKSLLANQEMPKLKKWV